jgi:hypothetical protein
VLSFELKSSLVCVVVLHILSLVCVALLTLISCFLYDLYCKGERLQLVEIPCKREEYSKIKHHGIQVDHWIT